MIRFQTIDVMMPALDWDRVRLWISNIIESEGYKGLTGSVWAMIFTLILLLFLWVIVKNLFPVSFVLV